MLKITYAQGGSPGVLRLEGKIIGPWVEELRSLLAAPRGEAPRGIDLAGVDFVDDAGADLLVEMRRRGLEVSNCSAFIAGLLESRAGRAQGSVSRR